MVALPVRTTRDNKMEAMHLDSRMATQVGAHGTGQYANDSLQRFMDQSGMDEDAMMGLV